jgi:peptidoglycan/LPS O-acetylase OafA/YrhL
MNKEMISTTVTWTKRILGVTAFILWGYVIYTIARSPAPFMEQAPYCMASTMLIFGLLTAAFKGLEYWERTNS